MIPLKPSVILISARAKKGKTDFLLDIMADAITKENLKVYFISLEMSKDAIMRRLERKINLLNVENKNLMKFKYYSPFSTTLEQVENNIHDLMIEDIFIPDLVCIDYFDLLEWSSSKKIDLLNEIEKFAINLNVTLATAIQFQRS